MTDPLGGKIGRFEIEARLGAGGMGEVYRARDPQLCRQVAIKRVVPELAADADVRSRLLREARNAARISSERVAALYDVHEEGDDLYLVMEHVDGVTLRERLARPFTEDEFLDIALQCVEGLSAAHQEGVVHGDIKPGNIMLGGHGEVKLLDFGVSRLSASRGDVTRITTATAAGVGGTVSYMAPEILIGHRSDHRADIFALGVVFYEMLSGQHPFRAATLIGTIDRILHDAPVPLWHINPALRDDVVSAINKMLSKDPEERYVTAADLAVDLRHARREITDPSRELQNIRPPSKRWNWRLGAAVGAIVLSAGLAWLWFGPQMIEDVGPRQIIAVLSTAEEDGVADTEMKELIDGLVSAMTTSLTRLTRTHQLQVTPASALRQRDVGGLESARSELGVTRVLEIDARRLEDKIGITVRLIDTGAMSQLDGREVIGSVNDVIALEEQVADAALSMLQLELSSVERGFFGAGTEETLARDAYLRGRGYLDDRRPALAVDMFQQAIRFDGRYARAHADLGRAYLLMFERGRDASLVAQATEACRTAVQIDDRDAGGHTCLGRLHNQTGQYDDAIVELERARLLDPTDDATYVELANAYSSAGWPERAEAIYREAISVRPHYWGGYSYLGRFYYLQGQYDDAIAAWAEAANRAPASYRSFSNLGVAYSAAGRWPEAVQSLERALLINPDYTGAISNLGTVYFYQGRYLDAARMFERATMLNERRSLYWGNLGDAYYWAPGERDRAAPAYRRALELAAQDVAVNPNDAVEHSSMARYHAMLGESEEARSCLEIAFSLAPDDMDVLYDAAQIEVMLGDHERGVDHLLQALEAGQSRAMVSDNPVLEPLLADERVAAALASG